MNERVVNIYEAKTHLSQLLQEVDSGKEIVIARAGRPMARLVPFVETPVQRKPGAWKNKVKIAPDFDNLPEDIAAGFEGK